jgi:hypothetical protein
MGNSQSVPEKRDARAAKRLSKARSRGPPSGHHNHNMPSSASAVPISSPNLGAQSLPNSSLPHLPIVGSLGQRNLSHSNLRSPSLTALARNDDDVSELRSPIIKEPFYNLTSPSSSAAHLSSSLYDLTPDSKTIDLNTAVALLEELRKTASPGDLVALRKFSQLHLTAFSYIVSRSCSVTGS